MLLIYLNIILFIYLFFYPRQLIAYKNIIEAIENLSISTVYGLHFYAFGTLFLNDYSQYVRRDSAAMDHLLSVANFFLEEEILQSFDYDTLSGWFDVYNKKQQQYLMFSDIFRRENIFINNSVEKDRNEIVKYYNFMTDLLISLRKFQNKIKDVIR